MPHRRLITPIGPIRIESDGRVLTMIYIGAGVGTDADVGVPDPPDGDPLLAEAVCQIDEYFAGTRRTFDLPLAPARSPRGQALRAAIAAIGHGETMSYGALARFAASGPRAIDQACARNPFPIVIPCHRVLGSDGIGHYSVGGGIDTKRRLLAHEAGETNDG